VGATFARIKNWTTEILSNTDLNSEIDNILNNLGPAGVDDYSVNSAQMKLQTSPGSLGSESLSTSLGGELERLRYVIQRIIGSGTSYWYEPPASSITDLVAALGSGVPSYRIASGKTTGNSSQLCSLIPSGSTASITLSASVTPFVYYIAGTPYSITADVTLTGLSLGPSANNTCSFNDTSATGQQWTKALGQYGTVIDVDGMGAGISSLVGQVAGFKAGNEYFVSYVTSTTQLTDAWRGALFNSAGAAVTAAGLSDNAEIKLMKLAWIFANTNSSLAVTYTNPVISGVQPTSPNTGDYWFDLGTTAWKTFNSTTWVAANATLIGLSLQNTAACVAARTFNSYKATSHINTIMLERASNTVVQARNALAEVSVFGNTNRFQVSRPVWDITLNLDSGLTETVSTNYYFYMKENATPIISDVAPMNRRDLQGLYHPVETWRCLGYALNDASSNLTTPITSFQGTGVQDMLLAVSPAAYGTRNGTPASSFPNNFKFAGMATNSAVPATGSVTYVNLTSFSIEPGLWKLSAVAASSFGLTGTTAPLTSFLAISNGSAATTTDHVNIFNVSTLVLGTASRSLVDEFYNSVSDYYVQVNQPTTYYLKAAVSSLTAVSTTVYFTGRMVAERLNGLNGNPA
jgi:hypothetical protein